MFMRRNNLREFLFKKNLNFRQPNKNCLKVAEAKFPISKSVADKNLGCNHC